MTIAAGVWGVLCGLLVLAAFGAGIYVGQHYELRRRQNGR